MNTTIAIALVTALSTIAGVAITGTITLLVSRSQNTTRLVLANSTQAYEHSRDMRQIRRDAYVQFLNQVSVIDRELHECWSRLEGPANGNAFLKNARDAVDKLGPLTNLLLLEGPHDVAVASMKLQSTLIEELTKLARTFAEAKGNLPLGIYDEPAFFESTTKRGNAKNEVILIAQEALDQT
jgi:hypothetical protein